MKIILLTSPQKMMAECDTLEILLEEGIDYLHLRKEEQDEEVIRRILNTLPKGCRSKIAIHGYKELAEIYKVAGLHHKSTTHFYNDFKTGFQSKSFHSIQEIKENEYPYQYGFLSPVFDSFSKENYPAQFDHEELKEFLCSEHKKFPVYALGGINAENAVKAKELGFDGVAILGYIWNEMFQHKKIENLKTLIQSIK